MRPAASLFFLAVLLSSGGCGAPDKERRSVEEHVDEQNFPVQESWNVTLTLFDAGFRKGTVQAGHVAEYRQKDQTIYHLDNGVSVVLYDKNANPPTTLKAEQAVIHANQDIEASGNVIITAENNTVLRTASIKRTAADHMIRSNSPVSISGSQGVLHGYGFESDEALKQYKIFRGRGEALLR